MVICLERGADLHMAQLMPLPLPVSCFSEIQIGFTFLVPAQPGSPGKRAVKWVCVCVLAENSAFSALTSDTLTVPSVLHCLQYNTLTIQVSFSASTLLVGHQEQHPICKN